VHLAAFRAIAQALGSPALAICADIRDDVFDLFLANGSLDDCVRLLTATLGPPQPSVDLISREISLEAERTVPGVWFLDRVPLAR
jgi:hypothetical protein